MSDPPSPKRKRLKRAAPTAITLSPIEDDEGKKQAAFTEDVARVRLSPFLEANPWSSIGVTKDQNGTLAVLSPWGENSVAFQIPPDQHDAEQMCDALNALVMPERYTAIWHSDTKLLEIIFTAYAIGEQYADLEVRKFTFHHNGAEHKCFFDVSSERLIILAEYVMPLGQSATQWRNLFSYHYYASARKGKIPSILTTPTKAISFWITNLRWEDQDSILDVINHLNFYMRYYDLWSPRIIVHSPKKETTQSERTTRYPFSKFPPVITSIPLDDHLLHFWEASTSGDPIRRFLYNYMILEYASYYHLDDNIKRKLRMLLSSPSALSDLDDLAHGIVETFADEKIHDGQKIVNMMKRCVDASIVWQEVEPARAVFVEKFVFDGGYTADHLIAKNCDEEEFKREWPGKMPSLLRDIRNALSHGREQRMASVITPTAANFERLQVWIPVLASIARQVMVYRNVP